MPRNSRIPITFVSALALCAVLSVPAATASRVVRIASHISISGHVLTFRGRVTSPNAACAADRRVTLYRTNGNVLGSTRTGPHGAWKITARGSAGISLGHFYAKVRQRSQGAAGTIYVCKAAVSRTIPFHS
ncbi:MAG TPA: hypothetical protein VK898_14220 [Chloroflexota bacterium]|nr:hypothetical protein [Chloroflexota bacterium]